MYDISEICKLNYEDFKSRESKFISLLSSNKIELDEDSFNDAILAANYHFAPCLLELDRKIICIAYKLLLKHIIFSNGADEIEETGLSRSESLGHTYKFKVGKVEYWKDTNDSYKNIPIFQYFSTTKWGVRYLLFARPCFTGRFTVAGGSSSV